MVREEVEDGEGGCHGGWVWVGAVRQRRVVGNGGDGRNKRVFKGREGVLITRHGDNTAGIGSQRASAGGGGRCIWASLDTSTAPSSLPKPCLPSPASSLPGDTPRPPPPSRWAIPLTAQSHAHTPRRPPSSSTPSPAPMPPPPTSPR